MKNLSKMTENVFVALVSILEKAMGGFDNFLYALAIVMAVEFITGLIAAVWDKKRSGMEWMKEILKKIIIFSLVAVGNVVDIHIIRGGNVIRTAVIFFYLSTEGISVLENVVRTGLPVPGKLKASLERLREGR